MRTRRPVATLAAAVAVIAGGLAAGQAGVDVEVRAPWVREAAAGQASTAAYFVVENRSSVPAVVVGVTSPVAATAELHTMQQMPAAGGMGDGRMGGMMRMVQVDRVTVPAHGRVEFKPGSFHVMLFKVTRALSPGDRVDLTIRFEGGATKTVSAVVGTRAAVSAP